MEYVGGGPSSFSQVFLIGGAVLVFVIGAVVILVTSARSKRPDR